MKKKIALLMAMVMLFAVTTAGTLAWLMDGTAKVENVFTIGELEITLDEDVDPDFHIVPGTSETKDPEVTVLADSEECWLFVKVETTGSIELVTYSIASGWTELTSAATTGAKVYYRSVSKSDADQPFDILADNTVSYADTLDKATLDAAVAPTMSFTAYAIQKANGNNSTFDVAAAWELAKTAPVTNP